MFNKIVSTTITLFVGYIVGTLIFFGLNGVFQLLILLHLAQLQNLFDQPGLKYWYAISILVLLILGIISVHKARKEKSSFYQIFKLTSEKLVTNLVFLVVFIGISFIMAKGYLQIIDLSNFTLFNYFNNPLGLIFGLIFSFLYLYPFSVAILLLYKSFRNKDKKTLQKRMLLILMILLLNPIIFYMGITGFGYYRYNQDIQSNKLNKCGARIVKPNPGSAAEAAGLKAYEIIYKVDDTPIQSPDDLLAYLNKINSSEPVKVETQITTYSVTPRKDPTTGQYRLGISIDQGYCKK